MATRHGQAGHWDGHVLLLKHLPRAGAAVARGQIEVLHAGEQAYDLNWQRRKIQDGLAEGFPAVHWSTEASTARTVMTRHEHLGFERKADLLCRAYPLSFMCQYAAQDSSTLPEHLCATHGNGLVDPLLHASRDGGRIVLAGEVDRSNHQVLAMFLEAATSRKRRDAVVIDMSALRFIDISGLRALMTGTERFRHRGGSVRLRDPRRHVQRIGQSVLGTAAHGFSEWT